MSNLILHGAYAYSPDLASIAEFDRLTATKATLAHVGYPMSNGQNPDGSLVYTQFPTALVQALWAQNKLTVITLGTWDYSSGHTYLWADILAGKHDVGWHAWAKAAAASGVPCFIRLDHEMNGTWSNLPYLTQVRADPAGFLAAWRYIVTLMRQDGATGLTWVWCPNAVAPVGFNATTAADKLAALYPGDNWVDWTGFDTYNNTAAAVGKTPSPWLNWQQLVSGYSNWIGDTYSTLLQIAPTKPIMVGEFGCQADSRKPAWVADCLAQTPKLYPQIGALVYFQRSYGTAPTGQQWALDGYDGITWKTGVTGPGYVQPGFLMPPSGVPIQPYRLTAVSGDPTAQVAQSAAAQAALTTQLAAANARNAQLKSAQAAAIAALSAAAQP